VIKDVKQFGVAPQFRAIASERSRFSWRIIVELINPCN